MKMIKTLTAVIALVIVLPAGNVSAHGERSLEPFIRMRTIQWYDMAWSTTEVRVNDELTISGRFHVAEDWPNNLARPDMAYLGVVSPGPVFVRKERAINGQPHLTSVALRIGGDYEFKIVLKARRPGRYHIHPSFNLKDTGNVTGPGQWITVTGSQADFTNPVKTLTGQTIDMEAYGTANGVGWHMFWMVLGVAWLVWWLRRPLWLPRHAMVQVGAEDELVTKTDRTIGKLILIAVPVIVFGAYFYTQSKYPQTIPLQTALDRIEPLPTTPAVVKARVERASYRVVDRALTMTVHVVNEGARPVQTGEFMTGSVRFLNPELDIDHADYPEAYLAESGLQVGADSTIQAGESKTITIVAADAAWETEHLGSVIRDVDSRFGGLLFFYNDEGRRYVTSVSGPMIPDFT